MGIIGVLKYFFGTVPVAPTLLERAISEAASALTEVASTKYARAHLLRVESSEMLVEAARLEHEAAAHDVLAARVQHVLDEND